MMRKVSYIALGVAIGLASTAWMPRSSSLVSNGAMAAAGDTYRQLNLFGDVFEKISTAYVEKPDHDAAWNRCAAKPLGLCTSIPVPATIVSNRPAGWEPRSSNWIVRSPSRLPAAAIRARSTS